LELSRKPEDVWIKLNKGSVRWAINKAEKSGVTVKRTRDLEDLRAFYEINALTKKDLGVPCHPWEFFKNMSDDEIKAKTQEFKERLNKGETLDDILPEAFAVVKQACKRMLGQEVDVK